MKTTVIDNIDLAPLAAPQMILTMSEAAIDRVRQLEAELLKAPQTPVRTDHLLHGGMYSRTMMVPAGVVLTGALIRKATILIIHGHFVLIADDRPIEIHGYNVFAGSKNRKQAGYAISDTYATVVAPSNAKTVEEAELEFTGESAILCSRHDGAVNNVMITGE